jgi:uncharacterized protein YndB with AHSA1/START domain
MSTDQIRKRVVLRAPRKRVWQALSDVNALSDWFGVKLPGKFAPGARLRGRVTHKGYEDSPFEITIERVEPEHTLSWHWHPNAIDPEKDYSTEPTTLVLFELEDHPDGTQLTITESGFDAIPSSRRFEAYQGNEKGWTMQMEAIQRYLAKAA